MKAPRAVARHARDIVRLTGLSFWRGFEGFYNSDDLTYAASIAYYALLSLFPFFLLALALLGRSTADVNNRNEVLTFVLRYFPAQFGFITTQLDAFRGDWQVYPGAGYIVAAPNPRGSTGFGQNFTAAISGDWTGKVMDDIHKVTDALKKLPYVDSERMGAMGWSFGGYAMMWIEGHNDLGFKALASMMGLYDLRAMYSSTEEIWFPEWEFKGNPWDQPENYRKASPSEFVKNFKTPCLVLTGEKDYRVPYTQSLEFFTDLQRRKVPSRLVVFEKAGHWPAWYEMALYYDAHLDWFHRYLGGPAAPWDPKAMVAGDIYSGEKDAKKDEKK